MSHNSQQNNGYIANFGSNITRLFVLFVACFSIFQANLSFAAINPGTKTERNPVRVLKSTLADLADRDQVVLDWQNQEFELIFNLPADGWYESLDLFLTAIPEGNVGRTDPITISYNGEKPVALYGQASRFDAHIKLDPARIRTARNSLKIRYKTPHKQDCLTPAHGKWVLDLGRSKLATKTRSKPRDLHIVEFKQRLNHPMTSPKRVAIRAFGPNKTALEALAAQGIASRMETLPTFQFTTGSADLEILIGEQSTIENLVVDKKMLEMGMTRAFTDKGSRPKLVLTAQSDAEVLEMAKGFATHHLPVARRRHVTLNEFHAAPVFNPQAVVQAGKYKLAEIGDTTIAPSWKPDPAELTFNVANPDYSSGKLTLNIVKSPIIDPASRLKVRLNNQSIGYTKLDKKQKFVSFDIKPGMFRSVENKITIEPVLTSPTQNYTCSTLKDTPALMVSNRSKLEIKTIAAPAEANLNQFAASGSPLFSSQSKPTAIVLTARTTTDRAASLQFIGYAAQKFGPQFATAEYLTELPPVSDRDRNILIIGPNAVSDDAILKSAPSALRLALRGKPTTGPNTLRIASLDRYASNNETIAIERLAQQLAKDTRISTGGIASLFPSPFSNKHMIGVVTANRSSQYSKSIKLLAQDGYWNGLQGSVARWNSETIMMAQTANILPASHVVQIPKTSLSEKIAVQWDQLAGKMKAMLNMPKKQPKPDPVPQAVAKSVQNPTVTKPAPITLRGTITPEIKKRRAATRTPLLVQAKSSVQKSYVAAQEKLTAFRDNDVNMVATRKWLRDQAHNRTTLMALIALSIVLMIGMATPKFDR